MTTTKKTKRKGATRRRTKKTASAGWLMLVAGLSIGLFIAFLTWLKTAENPLHLPPAGTAETLGPAQTQKPATVTPLPVTTKIEPSIKITLPPVVTPRFEFYENLPRQTVDAPVNNYSIKKKQAPLLQIPTTTKSGKGQYILQAGSFRKHRDAERRIAQLALLGIEARIEKIKADDKYWHRVRIGPFSSINETTRISTQLHSQAIQTMMVNTGK